MFYDNFIRMCNKAGKSPSFVASEIGLTRASVSGWKHGKRPTDATIHKLADYFNVEIGDLVNNEADSGIKKEPATVGRLDGKQGEIMELLSSLSDDQLDLVLERCRTLAEINQQQKK